MAEKLSGGGSAGRVAVVTGGARGVGRGVALILGETGATVYVTDLESRSGTDAVPGRTVGGSGRTVEDTAEQVTARGGHGVPVRLDHRDDTAVRALFHRVGEEHGGLDLLVANAFAGNALPFTPGRPFWELPDALWANMMEAGVRSHLEAARHAAPLLIERRGLLVFTGFADEDSEVIGHVYYDLAMTAITRLTRTVAHDLRPHGVTVTGVSPGVTRTEALVDALGEDIPGSDSVEFPGRAVRALLEDPGKGELGGRMTPVADLAARYGFTDLDP